MNIPLILTTIIFISSVNYVESLLCYSCSDLKSNEQCFNTTMCPDGEACYGRADGLLTSEVKHTTGCTKELKPQQRNDTLGFSFCAQACHDDLCNLHSCQLLSDNSTKPPRCLSCDSVDSPSQCQNVVQCKYNEVCFSEKVFTYHHAVHRFGCVNDKAEFRRKLTSKTPVKIRTICFTTVKIQKTKTCCLFQECNAQPVDMAAIVGKRNDEKSCSVCCKTDHCNLKACSNNPAGQVFPLKPISPGVCTDSDPILCSTFGRLNGNACREQTVLLRCPSSYATCAHVVWGSWQPWSTCSASCGLGTRNRSRTCHRCFNFVGTCAGPSVSSKACEGHNCPVNGRWCHEKRNECEFVGSYHPEYRCEQKTYKSSCSCPSPQNGGLPCDT